MSPASYKIIPVAEYHEAQLLLCDHFNVNECLLTKRLQFHELKYVRWMVWKILKSKGYSLHSISAVHGGEGGKFDHTTIMNALAKLPKDINHYKDVRAGYELIKDFDLCPLTIDENAILKHHCPTYFSLRSKKRYANQLQGIPA